MTPLQPPLGRSGKELVERIRVRESIPLLLEDALSAVVSAVSIKVRSIGSIRVIVGTGVDTNRDPGEQAVGDVVRVEVDKVGEGVVVGVVGRRGRPHVVLVAEHGDVVGVVRVGGLDCGAERLVEEELADVGDVAAGVCKMTLISITYYCAKRELQPWT